MSRFSRFLKAGILAVALMMASTVGVAFAYSVFSVDLGPVTIQEPLQVSLSPATPVNQKVPAYPGEAWRATYRIVNVAPVDYQLAIYSQFSLVDETKTSPYVDVKIRDGKYEYYQGQPIPIKGLMTYEFTIEVSISKSSPPGALKDLKINFERIEIIPCPTAGCG